MTYENLIIEKKGHIAIITLNHPPVNAWNRGLMEDFEKAIDEIEKDKNVRVLILTGAGEKCFSAGFDVSDAANAHITGPSIAQRIHARVGQIPRLNIASTVGQLIHHFANHRVVDTVV